MSKKQTLKKTNARGILTQYKANRNKRYDPITDTVAPRIREEDRIYFGELNKINDELVGRIALVKDSLDRIVGNTLIMEGVNKHPEQKLFIGAYNTFNSDVSVFLDDIETLQSDHSKYKGFVKNDNDLAIFHNFHGRYADLHLLFADITAPAVATIGLITTDVLRDIAKGDAEVDEIREIVSSFNEGNATREEIEKQRTELELIKKDKNLLEGVNNG